MLIRLKLVYSVFFGCISLLVKFGDNRNDKNIAKLITTERNKTLLNTTYKTQCEVLKSKT